MLEGDNSHPPFLYGTHYSTPGYVLYWLVRAAPAHMLRLQNGRFDAPDRLFASVADSWESVLNNPADLKELIPEFFAPPSDFLVKRFINPNSFSAGLGFRIMFIFPCFPVLGFGHSTEMVSPEP
jgi:hypothetical protein